MSSQVEKIKDALDVVDVVGSYLKLEKAGRNFKARCPFHNEKTPSFFVSPERNTYHCFGCNRGGDIFTFVEEFEGVDFKGALTMLAERAGVELQPIDPQKQDARERLFKALTTAQTFFMHQLTIQSDVRDYIAERGISKQTGEAFGLGFAPDAWRALQEHMHAQGFSDEELLQTGLLKKNEEGKMYDTFRSRVMFPITDPSGRIVAFSGRLFGDGDVAKYLNSPETELFNKSATLYAYHRAKMAMRRHDFAIVVEGQIDVLMSHQAGFANTVAPLGTALTDEHLTRITRLTKNIVLGLDGDKAGIASARRGAQLALARGCDVKVAVLPEGKDPADLVLEDPELWKKAVRESQHIIDFLLDVYKRQTSDKRSFAKQVTKEVLPYLTQIENKVDQEHFLKVIADRINVSEDAVREEMSKQDQQQSPQEEDASYAEVTHISTPKEVAFNKLVGLLLWQAESDTQAIDVNTAWEKLEEILAVTVKDNLELDETKKNELMFEAEMLFKESDHIETYYQELIQQVHTEHLQEQLALHMTLLKEAEQEKDPVKALEILKQCKDISEQLEALKQSS